MKVRPKRQLRAVVESTRKTKHLRWEEEVGTDTTSAGPVRERASIPSSTRRAGLSTKVGVEAPETRHLRVPGVLVFSQEGVSDKHAEALFIELSVSYVPR